MRGGNVMAVRVPRVNEGAGDGQHVPGIHEALARFAAARVEDDERRKARMMASKGYFFLRSPWAPGLAKAVAAGKTVTLQRIHVELALDRDWDGPGQRPRLPFASGVRLVRVSPDDRVMPGAGG